MAITLDATLGSNSANGPASVTITTGAAVAAGARVVACMSYFQNPAVSNPTCTIGGSAAVLDKYVTNGTDYIAIFSLVVAGGLASSSSIVVTEQGAGGGGGIFGAACSYLGTTGVDTSTSNTGTTAAAWSSGSATNTVADALYVCGAGTDGSMTSESSTPSVGNERFDLFLLAANQGMVFQDLIVASAASRALTGTWGTTTNLTAQTMGLVVYKGSAGAARAKAPRRSNTAVQHASTWCKKHKGILVPDLWLPTPAGV